MWEQIAIAISSWVCGVLMGIRYEKRRRDRFPTYLLERNQKDEQIKLKGSGPK